MTKSILVICAHPDDEVLGCGGTVARHITDGDFVHLLVLADGVSSRDSGNSHEVTRRYSAAMQSVKILGFKTYKFLTFPDNKMDTVPLLDIVQEVEREISLLNPEIIYTHHCNDLNIDHRITFQAVLTACRPIPKSSVKEIYSFEVMSSTEWAPLMGSRFAPSLYVDITKFMDIKIDALRAYSEELRPSPHSRSLNHLKILAHHRGYAVGVEAAEAFEVVRIVR